MLNEGLRKNPRKMPILVYAWLTHRHMGAVFKLKTTNRISQFCSANKLLCNQTIWKLWCKGKIRMPNSNRKLRCLLLELHWINRNWWMQFVGDGETSTLRNSARTVRIRTIFVCEIYCHVYLSNGKYEFIRYEFEYRRHVRPYLIYHWHFNT